MRAAPRRSSHDAALRVARAAGEALLRDARSRYADFPLTPGDSAPRRHDSPLPPVVSSRNRTANQFPLLSFLLCSTYSRRRMRRDSILARAEPLRINVGCFMLFMHRVFKSIYAAYTRCMYTIRKSNLKETMIIAITRRLWHDERSESILSRVKFVPTLMRDWCGDTWMLRSSSSMNTGNSTKKMIVSGWCSAAIVSKIQS